MPSSGTPRQAGASTFRIRTGRILAATSSPACSTKRAFRTTTGSERIPDRKTMRILPARAHSCAHTATPPPWRGLAEPRRVAPGHAPATLAGISIGPAREVSGVAASRRVAGAAPPGAAGGSPAAYQDGAGAVPSPSAAEPGSCGPAAGARSPTRRAGRGWVAASGTASFVKGTLISALYSSS